VQNTSRPLIGILLMVGAMASLPFIDMFAKILGSQGLPIVLIVCARVGFGALMTAPLAWRAVGPTMWRRSNPWFHLLRAALFNMATFCFFWSLKYLPLADALAIFFVQPLVLTALSGWFFGEKVGLQRWAAVMVGFVGVLIIVRPGLAAFNLGTVFAFGSGCALALYLALSRKIAGELPAIVTTFQTSALCALILIGILPFIWITATTMQWGMLAAMGVFGTLGQFLMLRSYDFAEASLLAPFAYTEIIMATALGWLVFGDFPDAYTIAGVAILVASALYIALHSDTT
jgi:drug/metabolite transporter (DMT)-like permease